MEVLYATFNIPTQQEIIEQRRCSKKEKNNYEVFKYGANRQKIQTPKDR